MTSPNTPEHIILLAKKWLEGSITDAERKEFELWYDAQDNVFEMTTNETREEAEERIYRALLVKGNIGENREARLDRGHYKLWPRIAAVAAFLLIVGAGLFFYSRYMNTLRHPDADHGLGLASKDIKPGGNKAYLILSDGKRLSLTDAANGELAKEAGVEITKTADGQVIYSSQPLAPSGRDAAGREEALNTIETPKGGQYQILLPDGSKVWLNAASKLIYPVSFAGRKQREVELSGEAYFEIYKNKHQPFVVKSQNQEVTVLGTHFNINSYVDEPATKTTLLEGSVSVRDLSYRRDDARGRNNVKDRDGIVLKPNEQAILKNNKINILPIDAETEIAWKNGKFIFNGESIAGIMRKISRWYDVDVTFDGDIGNQTFTGSVNRFDDISTLLRKIEMTNTLHFKIEGRRIAVTR